MSDVRATWVFGTRVTEGLPTAQCRLGRSPAHAESHPAISQEVQLRSFFREVQGVLVAHVDHAGTHFDTAGARRDGAQQRHGGRRLACVVVYAEVRAVDTQLIGTLRDLDGIPQGLACIGIAGPAPGSVVTETEKTETLHSHDNILDPNNISGSRNGGYFPSQADAATTMAAVAFVSVGWMTGANRGE